MSFLAAKMRIVHFFAVQMRACHIDVDMLDRIEKFFLPHKIVIGRMIVDLATDGAFWMVRIVFGAL